jgi:hypothetical protein
MVAATPDAPTVPSRAAPVKALLQTRGKYLALGTSRVYGPQRLREHLVGNVVTEVSPERTAVAAAVPATTGQLSAVCLVRSRGAVGRLVGTVPRPGFLTQIFNKKAAQKYTMTSLHDETFLSRQQRRYRELQFYHRRPKLRLPNTAMARHRRRKSGLVVFIRNSLKRPKTRVGCQRLFLPPVASLSVASTRLTVGHTVSESTFAAYERHDDAHPVF